MLSQQVSSCPSLTPNICLSHLTPQEEFLGVQKVQVTYNGREYLQTQTRLHSQVMAW